MDIITRKEAKALGLKRYFTGKSCKNGHIEERYTCCNNCILCDADGSKKYYKKNSDKIIARSKKRQQDNPVQYANYQKQRHQEHPEYKNKWYLNNPGRNAAKTKKYKVSKLQRLPIWVSQDELEQIKIVYEIAANMSMLDGIQYYVDHTLPLRGKKVSGLHILSNLQIIPHIENCSKGNRYRVL